MRRKAIAKFTAFCLAAVLVFSNGITVRAADVTSGDLTGTGTVSDGDAGTETPTEPTEPTGGKLAAPTNVRWGENFSVECTGVAEAHGNYHLEVYKDGEFFHSVSWSGMTGEEISFPFSDEINESGTYKVRIQAENDYDPDTLIDSDFSEFSEERVYVRPAQALGTTTGYWDAAKPGIFHYTTVIGAGGYYIDVLFTPVDGDYEYSVYATWWTHNGYAETEYVELTEDLTRIIQENGAGKYRVAVRALSGDVDKIANGETGEFSEYYDSTQTADVIEDKLNEILNNGDLTAEEARDQVSSEMQKSALQIAMQTDDSVKEQIKTLEEKYVAEKGITVDKSVSEEASAYVKADQISMVGAGLNADAGNISLDVTVPEEKVDVSEVTYKNSVQLDIKLVNDGTSIHELTIPISITMPIPAGLDVSRLVILHYHEDGSVETVAPKNNGDGTITFTVKSFSTFVFAEAATWEPEEPEAPTTSGGGGCNKPVSVDWNAAAAKIDATESGNVNVVTGEKMEVQQNVLSKIVGKDVTLAMHTGTGLAFSVSGKNLAADCGDLFMYVDESAYIEGNAKQEVLAGTLYSRSFGIEKKAGNGIGVALHVSVGEEFAGKYANLYRFDDNAGKLQLVGVFRITENGQAMFGLPSGGKYVLTVTEKAGGTVVSIGGGYTVVSGDTLSKIAAANGVSVQALLAANPQIKDANMIYSGQVIQIAK